MKATYAAATLAQPTVVVTRRAIDNASRSVLSAWSCSEEKRAGLGLLSWLELAAEDAILEGDKQSDGSLVHRNIRFYFEQSVKLVDVELVDPLRPRPPKCNTCHDTGSVRRRQCHCTTAEWFACPGCPINVQSCPDCAGNN